MHPSAFAAIHALIPENAEWSVAGVGPYQLDANLLGIAFGGNVRTGLEDNIYLDKNKKVLASNEQLVQRIVDIAGRMGLKIASFEETCQRLGITKP
jgi:3-keto-5-aminohexanoate cleavage enzyme